MASQRTLAAEVSCTGVGLHAGAPVALSLRPAEPGAGLCFVRGRGAARARIPAAASAVVSTANATTLAAEAASGALQRVATVEHLLAALRSLGVDNAEIELDADEVPVMDGSAAPFVELIERAGLAEQAAPRRVWVVERPLAIEDGERSLRVEPAEGFAVTCEIDFAHPAIGRQRLHCDRIDAAWFTREVAPARTFGFLADVQALWDAGLARGGSMDNTVLLDAEKVVNPGGLRWPDEFVRHKTLDLLGDLALLGAPIQGHIQAQRGGHTLHVALAKALPTAATLEPTHPDGAT